MEKNDKIKSTVRLINTDIPGHLSTKVGLTKIKGVGHNMAKIFCQRNNLDYDQKIGTLTDDQIEKLQNTIKSVDSPSFILNKRNVNEKSHLVGSKIEIDKRETVNLLRRIRAYRGIRHESGLPVRGQRTRGCFRGNKTLGVQRRKNAKSGK